LNKTLKKKFSLNKGLSWSFKLSNEKGQSPLKLYLKRTTTKLKNFKRQTRKAQNKEAKPFGKRDYDKTFKERKTRKSTQKESKILT